MISETTETTVPSAPTLRTFKEIIPQGSLLEAVEGLNFPAPTPVQVGVIPPALSGKDLVVQAKTGSGKTLAYVVPMLGLVERSQKQRGTMALVVAPTRELANQICNVISSLNTSIKPACLIGGENMRDQEEALAQDNRVVVGTPGRLLDFIRQRLILLRSCKYFVLDEADEMLSMGFLEEVRAILSRLPDQRQGLFVSATITPRVEMLASSFLSRAERIIINSVGEENAPIDHRFVTVAGELTAKANMLCDLIETQRPHSAIIFCNTKSDTELVEVFLRRRGFDARRINSDLTQRERNLIISQVRSSELRLLIATDIAARGLDIDQIDLVVNYSIPTEAEVYVHRSGRTGRAGRQGRAIALVGPQDFSAFQNLKRFISFELTPLAAPTEEELVAARVAHFHEIARELSVEMQPRELLIARKLVSDLGNISDPPDELVAFVGKLYRVALEHAASRSKPQPAAEKADQETNQPEQAKSSREQRPQRHHDNRRRHQHHSRDDHRRRR
ncbi:MAG: DEAD/DEAH box helicase [Oligoflexia bacterium]|nr:DEAD/DEAH box helicase [Oligoflexia bacterium]